MKVIVDTNILARVLLRDDPVQAAQAEAILTEAETVHVPLPVWCELCWLLGGRSLRYGPDEIACAIETFMAAGNVVTDRSAVAMGLTFLRAGGDFADGAIAAEGVAGGGARFLSFDRRAVALANQCGLEAAVPGTA